MAKLQAYVLVQILKLNSYYLIWTFYPEAKYDC